MSFFGSLTNLISSVAPSDDTNRKFKPEQQRQQNIPSRPDRPSNSKFQDSFEKDARSQKPEVQNNKTSENINHQPNVSNRQEIKNEKNTFPKDRTKLIKNPETHHKNERVTPKDATSSQTQQAQPTQDPQSFYNQMTNLFATKKKPFLSSSAIPLEPESPPAISQSKTKTSSTQSIFSSSSPISSLFGSNALPKKFFESSLISFTNFKDNYNLNQQLCEKQKVPPDQPFPQTQNQIQKQEKNNDDFYQQQNKKLPTEENAVSCNNMMSTSDIEQKDLNEDNDSMATDEDNGDSIASDDALEEKSQNENDFFENFSVDNSIKNKTKQKVGIDTKQSDNYDERKVVSSETYIDGSNTADSSKKIKVENTDNGNLYDDDSPPTSSASTPSEELSSPIYDENVDEHPCDYSENLVEKLNDSHQSQTDLLVQNFCSKENNLNLFGNSSQTFNKPPTPSSTAFLTSQQPPSHITPNKLTFSTISDTLKPTKSSSFTSVSSSKPITSWVRSLSSSFNPSSLSSPSSLLSKLDSRQDKTTGNAQEIITEQHHSSKNAPTGNLKESETHQVNTTPSKQVSSNPHSQKIFFYSGKLPNKNLFGNFLEKTKEFKDKIVDSEKIKHSENGDKADKPEIIEQKSNSASIKQDGNPNSCNEKVDENLTKGYESSLKQEERLNAWLFNNIIGNAGDGLNKNVGSEKNSLETNERIKSIEKKFDINETLLDSNEKERADDSSSYDSDNSAEIRSDISDKNIDNTNNIEKIENYDGNFEKVISNNEKFESEREKKETSEKVEVLKFPCEEIISQTNIDYFDSVHGNEKGNDTNNVNISVESKNLFPKGTINEINTEKMKNILKNIPNEKSPSVSTDSEGPDTPDSSDSKNIFSSKKEQFHDTRHDAGGAETNENDQIANVATMNNDEVNNKVINQSEEGVYELNNDSIYKLNKLFGEKKTLLGGHCDTQEVLSENIKVEENKEMNEKMFGKKMICCNKKDNKKSIVVEANEIGENNQFGKKSYYVSDKDSEVPTKICEYDALLNTKIKTPSRPEVYENSRDSFTIENPGLPTHMSENNHYTINSEHKQSFDDGCACCGGVVATTTNNYDKNDISLENSTKTYTGDIIIKELLLKCSICSLYSCSSCISQNQSLNSHATTLLQENHDEVETGKVVCRLCADELKHASDSETDSDSKSSDCLTIETDKQTKLINDLKKEREKFRVSNFLNYESIKNAQSDKNNRDKNENNRNIDEQFVDENNLQSSINSQMFSSFENDEESLEREKKMIERKYEDIEAVENSKSQINSISETFDKENLVENSYMEKAKRTYNSMESWSISPQSNAHFGSIAEEIMSEVICDLKSLSSAMQHSYCFEEDEKSTISNSFPNNSLVETQIDKEIPRHVKERNYVDPINDSYKPHYENNLEFPKKSGKLSLSSSSSSSYSSDAEDLSDNSLYESGGKSYKMKLKSNEKEKNKLNIDSKNPFVGKEETNFDWDGYIRESLDRSQSPLPPWCNWSSFEQNNNDKNNNILNQKKNLEENQKEFYNETEINFIDKKKETFVTTNEPSLEESKKSDSAYSVDTYNEEDDTERSTLVQNSQSSTQYCHSEESEYDFDENEGEKVISTLNNNTAKLVPAKTENDLKSEKNPTRSQSMTSQKSDLTSFFPTSYSKTFLFDKKFDTKSSSQNFDKTKGEELKANAGPTNNTEVQNTVEPKKSFFDKLFQPQTDEKKKDSLKDGTEKVVSASNDKFQNFFKANNDNVVKNNEPNNKETNTFFKSFQNKFSKLSNAMNLNSNNDTKDSSQTQPSKSFSKPLNNEQTTKINSSSKNPFENVYLPSNLNNETSSVEPAECNLQSNPQHVFFDHQAPFIKNFEGTLMQSNVTSQQPSDDVSTSYSVSGFNPINVSASNVNTSLSVNEESSQDLINKHVEDVKDSTESIKKLNLKENEVSKNLNNNNTRAESSLDSKNLQQTSNGSCFMQSFSELSETKSEAFNDTSNNSNENKTDAIFSIPKTLSEEIDIGKRDFEEFQEEEKNDKLETKVEPSYEDKLKKQLKQIEDCSNESFEEKLEAFLKLDDFDSCVEMSENENKNYLANLSDINGKKPNEDLQTCGNQTLDLNFQEYELQKEAYDQLKTQNDVSSSNLTYKTERQKFIINHIEDQHGNSQLIDPLEVAFIGFTNELANLTREDSQTTKSSSQPDFKTVTTLLEKSESSYATSSKERDNVKKNIKLKYPLKSIKSVPAFMNPSFQLERNNSDEKCPKVKKNLIVTKEPVDQKVFHKSHSASFPNKIVKSGHFNWSSLKDLKVPLEDVLAELDKTLQPQSIEEDEDFTPPFSAPISSMRRCPSYSNILHHPSLKTDNDENKDFGFNSKLEKTQSSNLQVADEELFDISNNTFAEVAATLKETTNDLETMKFDFEKIQNITFSQSSSQNVSIKNPKEKGIKNIEAGNEDNHDERLNKEKNENESLDKDNLFQTKVNVISECLDYTQFEKYSPNLPDLLSDNSEVKNTFEQLTGESEKEGFNIDGKKLTFDNNYYSKMNDSQKGMELVDSCLKESTAQKNIEDIDQEGFKSEKDSKASNMSKENTEKSNFETSKEVIKKISSQRVGFEKKDQTAAEAENTKSSVEGAKKDFDYIQTKSDENNLQTKEGDDNERMRSKSEMMRIFSMSRHRDTSPEPIYLEGLKSPCFFEPELDDPHFFSDEDLREIDLDEDIPPKHLFKNFPKNEKSNVFSYSIDKSDERYKNEHFDKLELKSVPKPSSKSLDLKTSVSNNSKLAFKSLDEKKLSIEILKVEERKITSSGVAYPEAMFERFMDFKNSLFKKVSKTDVTDKSIVHHRRHSETWKETKRKYNSLDESISSQSNLFAMRSSWSIRSFSVDSPATDFCVSNNYKDQQEWEYDHGIDQRPSHLFGFAPKKDFNLDKRDDVNVSKFCEAFWSEQDEKKFLEDNKKCQLIDESYQNIQELMKIAAAKTSPFLNTVEDERDYKAEISEMAKLKLLERNDSDEKIINIFGIQIPKSIHSLHQRIKDEIKIVTATKRLRLDEAEEIRMMEAAMIERRKQRRKINGSESFSSYGDFSIKKDYFYRNNNEVDSDLFSRTQRMNSNDYPNNEWSKSKLSEHFKNVLNDISDLPLLSESRQSRISSMSSISVSSEGTKNSTSFHGGLKKNNENKTNSFGNKWYFTNDRQKNRRSESSNSCFSEGYLENQAIEYNQFRNPSYKTHSSQIMYPQDDVFYNENNQEFVNAKKLQPYSLNTFSSNNSLPQSRSSSMSRSINSNLSSDYDFFYNESNNYHANYDYYNKYSPEYESACKIEQEEKIKQEKLNKLRLEIEKRKKHLQEITPKTSDLPCPQTPPSFRELYASHQWAPQKQSQEQYWNSEEERQVGWLNDELNDNINFNKAESSGIIKPIDYQIKSMLNNQIQREDYILRQAVRQNEMSKNFIPLLDDNDDVIIDKYPQKSSSANKLNKKAMEKNFNYNSTQQLIEGRMGEQNEIIRNRLKNSETYLVQNQYLHNNQSNVFNKINESNSFSTPSRTKVPQITSESEESLLKYNPPTHASSRDSGVSSSGVSGEISDRFVHMSNKMNDGPSHVQTTPHYATASRKKMSNVAQCRMGVVYTSNKKAVKEIDNKEERTQQLQPTEENLQNSYGKRLFETKARSYENNLSANCQSPYVKNKYNHKTKNILLTADANDKRFKEHGFGLIITGGQSMENEEKVSDDKMQNKEKNLIEDASNTLKAIVTFIMPGSIADQLNNELQEGDEIVEWNGIVLRGRSEEEVKEIIDNNTFYELELVVKSYVRNVSEREMESTTMSTICTLDSSSGDQRNLRSNDSPERHLKHKQLINLKSEIKQNMNGDKKKQQIPFFDQNLSPNPSSQNPSISLESFTNDILALKQSNPSMDNNAAIMGEIQLQLSYDDYDGTLNVHVIQARNLVPKIKLAYTDPLVKIFLLPYKCSAESRRKTRCVPRTLHPEWHQTVMFMNVEQKMLSEHLIEVSVWDHDKFLPDQFLGEILLDLSNVSHLDNRPHWYSLKEDGDSKFGRRPRTSTASSSSESGGDTSTNSSSEAKQNWREDNRKKGRKKHRNSDNATASEERKKSKREASSNKRKSKRNQFGSNKNVNNSTFNTLVSNKTNQPDNSQPDNNNNVKNESSNNFINRYSENNKNSVVLNNINQLKQQNNQPTPQTNPLPCNYGGECSKDDKTASMRVKDLHIHWVHNSTNSLAVDPAKPYNKDSQNRPFSTYVRRTVSSVWNSFACCSKYDNFPRDQNKNNGGTFRAKN